MGRADFAAHDVLKLHSSCNCVLFVEGGAEKKDTRVQIKHGQGMSLASIEQCPGGSYAMLPPNFWTPI